MQFRSKNLLIAELILLNEKRNLFQLMFYETQVTNVNFIERNIRAFHYWLQVGEMDFETLEPKPFSEFEIKKIEQMILDNELFQIIKNNN